MKFVLHDCVVGKPSKALHMNGKIVGWICTTVNGWWTYTLSSSRIDHGEVYDHQNDKAMKKGHYLTEQEAENALLGALSCT